MWIANGNAPGPSSGILSRVRMDGTDEESFDLPTRNFDIAIMPDERVAYMAYDDETNIDETCSTVHLLDPESGTSETVYHVADADPTRATGCRANAINWWPEHQAFTVSVDSWDAIIAFTASGELLWILGGLLSSFTGADWSGGQYNHHWLTDSVLLFNSDNGDDGSSALEYRLGESTATLFFDYTSEFSSASIGDVKRLPNGNTLVTYANRGLIQEVSPNREPVQEIETSGIGYTVRRKSLYGPPPPYAE